MQAQPDGDLLDLGRRLQRQLLAILLVEAGHVVSVDRLVDLLWADAAPPAAPASLQAYVLQLRRILEPDRPPRAPARVLVTQDPGYALEVERIAAAAADGEIWASSTVPGLVAGSGHGFQPGGEHRLKGVDGEWRLASVAK